MSNTYTQIHIHAIFAVKNRRSLIKPEWEVKLHKYITGIIARNGHKPIIINGTEDHIHILFGMKPYQSLSALMQDVKGDSSKWINNERFVSGKFSWQEGYGAFSLRMNGLPVLIRYIENQKEHHKKKCLDTEYRSILEKNDVEYDNRYILKNIDS